MKKIQYQLDSEYSLEENKNFCRQIFESGMNESRKWFDRKEGTVRVLEEDMTLERYLSQLNESGNIRLQIGDPFEDEIRLGLRTSWDGSSHFAWMVCSLTDENYKAIQNIYTRVYRKNLLKESE